jgi:hypothetical protein
MAWYRDSFTFLSYLYHMWRSQKESEGGYKQINSKIFLINLTISLVTYKQVSKFVDSFAVTVFAWLSLYN